MPTSRGTVAIVEDDDAMRRSIERLLQANGYETIAFASAEAFLDGVPAVTVMALVLDVHLGGLSGLELRRKMSIANSSLPVVFITAYDDEATRREAFAAGCVDYLQKPFDAGRLIASLERSRNP